VFKKKHILVLSLFAVLFSMREYSELSLLQNPSQLRILDESVVNFEPKNSANLTLQRYSTNGTVIVTICNLGMTEEWLQQWYVSGRRLGISNMVVILTDREAYGRVREQIGDRALLFTDVAPLLASERWKKKESNNERRRAYNWRSSGYEEIVIQRATILKHLLLLSELNILYSDTDIHWIKNPMENILQKYSTFHMCIQREKGDELGDYNCSGFLILKYSEVTIIFLSTWEKYIKQRLEKKGFFTDQEELNKLLKDMQNIKKMATLPPELRCFRAVTLDWDEYPSGINYFSMRRRGRGKLSSTCSSKVCQKYTWDLTRKNSRQSSLGNFIVHHNYAKSNQIKIERAKDAGLWLDLSPEEW